LVVKENKSFFKKIKNRYEHNPKKEVDNLKSNLYGMMYLTIKNKLIGKSKSLARA
jgi:hypothetical protein